MKTVERADRVYWLFRFAVVAMTAIWAMAAATLGDDVVMDVRRDLRELANLGYTQKEITVVAFRPVLVAVLVAGALAALAGLGVFQLFHHLDVHFHSHIVPGVAPEDDAAFSWQDGRDRLLLGGLMFIAAVTGYKAVSHRVAGVVFGGEAIARVPAPS